MSCWGLGHPSKERIEAFYRFCWKGATANSYLQVLFPLLLKRPLQVSHVVVFEVLDFAPRGTQSLLDREAHALIATGGGVYVRVQRGDM